MGLRPIEPDEVGIVNNSQQADTSVGDVRVARRTPEDKSTGKVTDIVVDGHVDQYNMAGTLDKWNVEVRMHVNNAGQVEVVDGGGDSKATLTQEQLKKAGVNLQEISDAAKVLDAGGKLSSAQMEHLGQMGANAFRVVSGETMVKGRQ